MNQILLSADALNALKEFSSHDSITSAQAQKFPSEIIDQLLSNKLIESHIVDYDFSSPFPSPCFSNYSITEFGKGYLFGIARDEEFIAFIKDIADSSKSRADLAFSESKTARKDSIFSKVVSIIAIIISICAIVIPLLY